MQRIEAVDNARQSPRAVVSHPGPEPQADIVKVAKLGSGLDHPLLKVCGVISKQMSQCVPHRHAFVSERPVQDGEGVAIAPARFVGARGNHAVETACKAFQDRIDAIDGFGRGDVQLAALDGHAARRNPEDGKHPSPTAGHKSDAGCDEHQAEDIHPILHGTRGWFSGASNSSAHIRSPRGRSAPPMPGADDPNTQPVWQGSTILTVTESKWKENPDLQEKTDGGSPYPLI